MPPEKVVFVFLGGCGSVGKTTYMINKIISRFIFIRLYYACLSPEKTYKNLVKGMVSFRKKKGIFGIQRCLQQRFFSIETKNQYFSEVYILTFRNKKQIEIWFVDEDRGPTGVNAIRLVHMVQDKAKVITEERNTRWLW